MHFSNQSLWEHVYSESELYPLICIFILFFVRPHFTRCTTRRSTDPQSAFYRGRVPQVGTVWGFDQWPHQNQGSRNRRSTGAIFGHLQRTPRRRRRSSQDDTVDTTGRDTVARRALFWPPCRRATPTRHWQLRGRGLTATGRVPSDTHTRQQMGYTESDVTKD